MIGEWCGLGLAIGNSIWGLGPCFTSFSLGRGFCAGSVFVFNLCLLRKGFVRVWTEIRIWDSSILGG